MIHKSFPNHRYCFKCYNDIVSGRTIERVCLKCELRFVSENSYRTCRWCREKITAIKTCRYKDVDKNVLESLKFLRSISSDNESDK